MERDPDKTDEQRLAIEPTIPALPENFRSTEGRPPEPMSSGSLPYVVVGLVIAVAAAFFWLSGRAPAPAPAVTPPAAAPLAPPVAAKPAKPATPPPPPVAAKPAPVAAPPAPAPAVAAKPATTTPKRAPKHHKKAHPKKRKEVKLPRLPNPPPAD